MHKKEQWVIDSNRKLASNRKQIRKAKYNEKRKKAIKRIRRSWASPHRNDKCIPEHVIKKYM